MSDSANIFEAGWRDRLRDSQSKAYAKGQNLRVDLAADVLPNGFRLLDVGCGSGELAIAAKHKFKEFYGIDVAESAVYLAEQNGVNAVVADLNCPPLPFADLFFDAIAIMSVLQYVQDPAQMLLECSRLLKPEGFLVVSVANMRSIGKLYKQFVCGEFPSTSKGSAHGYDGGALHYFCSQNVVKLLLQCGFRPLHTFGIFYKPTMMGSVPLRLSREYFAGETMLTAVKER